MRGSRWLALLSVTAAELASSASRADADSAPALPHHRGEHWTIDVPPQTSFAHGALVRDDGTPLPFWLYVVDDSTDQTLEQVWAVTKPTYDGSLFTIDGPTWSTTNGHRWFAVELTRDSTLATMTMHVALAVDAGHGYVAMCGSSHATPVEACEPMVGSLRVGADATAAVAPPYARIERGTGWAIALPDTWKPTATPGIFVSPQSEHEPMFVAVSVAANASTLAALAEANAQLMRTTGGSEVHSTTRPRRLGTVAGLAQELSVQRGVEGAAGGMRATIVGGRALSVTCIASAPTPATRSLCAAMIRSFAASTP